MLTQFAQSSEAGPSKISEQHFTRQHLEEESNLSDDELLDELAAELDDDFMATYREQRIEQMRNEADEASKRREEQDYGHLGEIKVEKDVIQATLKNKRCIIHFYHPDFRRCQVMNRHLEILARKHTTTRFLRVDVANVPFLVVKLEIKVLPQIICFEGGVTKDKIIGFDTVGKSTDNFTTAQLELRLSQSGVIDSQVPANSAIRRPNFTA